MAGLPGGCKTTPEFERYVHNRVVECMRICKSKEETVRHLQDQYRIIPELTNFAWDNIEREHQDFYRSYYAACQNSRRIRERDATKVTAPTAQFTSGTGFQQDSEMPTRKGSSWFNSMTATEQDHISRLMEREAAASSQVRHQAPNPQIFVGENSSKAGALQAPQEPISPSTEFWKQLMITLGQMTSTLGQMTSTLGQIKSNTDQMAKVMTDGHGFGPNGSSKRKRVEKEKESGDKEEEADLQKQETGGNEEAEKPQEQKRGDNEKAEQPLDLNEPLPQ